MNTNSLTALATAEQAIIKATLAAAQTINAIGTTTLTEAVDAFEAAALAARARLAEQAQRLATITGTLATFTEALASQLLAGVASANEVQQASAALLAPATPAPEPIPAALPASVAAPVAQPEPAALVPAAPIQTATQERERAPVLSEVVHDVFQPRHDEPTLPRPEVAAALASKKPRRRKEALPEANGSAT